MIITFNFSIDFLIQIYYILINNRKAFKMGKRNDIGNATLQELIDWRDIASFRIDHNRKTILNLPKIYKSLDAKILSDIEWVSQLNKEISKKAFPTRSNESKQLSLIFNGKINP